MRLVEVTSVSNLLFTFFVPMMPRRLHGPAVESFLGPVDVFHSVDAAALPQWHGRRVVTVHDLTCLYFPQFHPWLRRTLFRLGIRRAARLADAILVPSHATKRDLAAMFRPAEAKIRVVPDAPAERFAPLDSRESLPVISRYGLPYRDYLLFAGNIEPRKNLLVLIDAYNRLRKTTRVALRLAIAGGEGWYNQPIHHAPAASPFAADIRFLGYVPDADLPAVMSGALAFVYPSLARLADAMERIVGEEPLREDLRERGLKQAQRFSWDETARLTVQVYEDRD